MSSLVKEPVGIQANTRLVVYRNGYYTRLQEALAKDFPTLLLIMGNARFGKVMATYLQANPPTEPSILYLGKALAGWLKVTDFPSVWSELASLEWAVLNAFDARDARSLSTERISQISPDRWEPMRFRLHPSVTLLRVSYNVREIWHTFSTSENPSQIVNIDDYFVVWRSKSGPKVKSISLVSYEMLLSWNQGKSFGATCEYLQTLGSKDNTPIVAAKCLFLAAQSGWLQDFDR